MTWHLPIRTGNSVKGSSFRTHVGLLEQGVIQLAKSVSLCSRLESTSRVWCLGIWKPSLWLKVGFESISARNLTEPWLFVMQVADENKTPAGPRRAPRGASLATPGLSLRVRPRTSDDSAQDNGQDNTQLTSEVCSGLVFELRIFILITPDFPLTIFQQISELFCCTLSPIPWPTRILAKHIARISVILVLLSFNSLCFFS